MAEFIMTRDGADLVASLQRDCGFGIRAAVRFLEGRTGQPFESDRLYSVAYRAGQKGLRWSDFQELRIWKVNGLPQSHSG